MSDPDRDADAFAATTPRVADGRTTPREGLTSRGEPAVGTVLGGRYRLRALLGQGGMGSVYLAWDEALGVDVALKFVHVDRMGEGGMAQLRAEVLLAQRVTHPNVCRTYDLEELDGERVVKMEYVAGVTLAQRLREGPLPVDEVVQIARSVAAALEAAHAQGVVHCDLKPHNILVEEATGRVVLMDFGLARATALGGHGGGTPYYMPPEQAAGRELDGRADLYALGCTLHQLLTGEPPYLASSPEQVAARHASDPIPDPRRRRPEVPEWLALVEKKLLAKSPDGRYPDAAALGRALEGPPPPRWRRAAPWIAGALAVLIAGGIGARVARRARRDWRPQVVDREVFDENGDAPRFSPDGRWLAWPATRDGAWRAWVEPTDGSRAARAVSPAGLDVLRLAWSSDGRALFVTDARHVSRVDVASGKRSPVVDDAILGDVCGDRILLLRTPSPGRPELVERSAASGVERVLARPSGVVAIGDASCDAAAGLVYFTAVVPTGTIADAPSDLYVVPLAGGEARALTHDHRSNRDPTPIPGTRAIVFSSARGGAHDLWTLSADGGEPLPITGGAGHAYGPTVSPDGRTLVYDEDMTGTAAYEVALDGTRPPRRLTQRLDDVSFAALTPDGRSLVLSVERDGSHVVLHDLASGEERRLADGQLAVPSPDGREVYYVVHGASGAPDRVEARSVDGTAAARRVTEIPRRVWRLLVDGSGRVRLFVRDGAGETWSAPVAGGEARRDATDARLESLSRDGRWRMRLDGTQPEARLSVWPADAAADAPPAVTLAAQRFLPAVDAGAIVYQTRTELRRRWIAGGRDERLASLPSDFIPIALSLDGDTLYAVRVDGRVRRVMITNFADAPRP